MEQERNMNRSWSGPRALLSKEQAIEIYMVGQAARDSGIDPLQGGRSAQMAKKYGVSPKAIRDIWNRRTWQSETKHLWAENEKPTTRCKKFVTPSSPSGHLAATKPNTAALSFESCDRSSQYFHSSHEFLARSSLPPAWPWPFVSNVATHSAQYAPACDLQEPELHPANYFAALCRPSPAPAARAPPQHPCGPAVDSDCGAAAAAEWEGPVGPCLPPASAGDADPFHADWPHW